MGVEPGGGALRTGNSSNRCSTQDLTGCWAPAATRSSAARILDGIRGNARKAVRVAEVMISTRSPGREQLPQHTIEAARVDEGDLAVGPGARHLVDELHVTPRQRGEVGGKIGRAQADVVQPFAA